MRIFTKSSAAFYRRVPADVKPHPQSDLFASHLLDNGSTTIAHASWSVPVYYAKPDTPRYTVEFDRFYFGGYKKLTKVPIPDHAQPDPAGDGHLTVVGKDCVFDLFEAHKEGDKWYAGWASSIRKNTGGIYKQGASCRGSGFSNALGLMAPSDFAKGVIDHALLFSYHTNKAGGPVSPASESDGNSSAAWAIPEGCRLYLPRNFKLDGLPKWQQIIGQALKDYGAYDGDNGGSTSILSFYGVNTVLGDEGKGQPYPWGNDKWPRLPDALIAALKVENYGAQTRSQYTPVTTCGEYLK